MIRVAGVSPIDGFPDYFVDVHGDVYSTKTGQLKVLRKSKDRKGYLKVYLYKENKRNFFKVHRLIAQTFIPNPDNKPQVNHKDANKTNNHVDNLEWVTNQENMDHAKHNNLLSGREGTSNGNSRYSDELITTLCKELSSGCSVSEVSQKFNVNRHLVKDLKAKKTWTHISNNFTFTRSCREILDRGVVKLIKSLIKDGMRNVHIRKYLILCDCYVGEDTISCIRRGKIYKEVK